MSWVAVAAAGAAVIGAGASYAGSKKQADAAKKGSNIQLQMFDRLNAQQQPYIQSGYGAMGRLNTLLGLGGPRAQGGGEMPMGGNASLMPSDGMQNHMYQPTPNGGMRQVTGGQGNVRLRQLLMLRAQNGDTEAARVLEHI